MRIVWKPYALAVLVTLAGVAITRATWPVFSVAPFAPVFGAVAVATHWGNGRAGLLSIVLAVAGIALAFPSTGGFPWHPGSFAGFAVIALIGSRLIDGRNRATAALHAREAELRATLESVRASEEMVRRAQKMEAVGQLAAGVAHNFNNLLQVTLGYADMLLEDREDALVRSAVTEIRRATDRGAVLTRQLLAFGRKHDPRVTRVDLGATIGVLGNMLARVIREDIELTMDLEGEHAVLIDPSDLEQVILNLVINARDALPSGGTIRISLERAAVDAAIAAREQSTAGEYVRLGVSDNGVGMTPEVQAHMFEPFFTTKEVGEGTGLGLPFVQGVARHAGGFVTIDSAPQQGTTVSLYLPPFHGPAAAAPAPATPPRSVASATPATILLVEDEAPVRKTTARMLERSGYTVLAAATPSEACSIFEKYVEKNGSRIDLLVTDIVMPEMHGPALAERLLAQHPGLRVLFVSGYSDAMPDIRAGHAKPAFLAKPFTTATLLAAVREALSPRREGLTP